MQDDPDPALLPSRDDIERFLAVVHPFASAEATYWHCQAGINRSSMLVAAYLHLYRGKTISEAIAHLRKERSEMVLCNATFERTLREWYGMPDEQDFEPFDIETWLRERNGGDY
jgi:protein-tyrosine phosphatase